MYDSFVPIYRTLNADLCVSVKQSSPSQVYREGSLPIFQDLKGLYPQAT